MGEASGANSGLSEGKKKDENKQYHTLYVLSLSLHSKQIHTVTFYAKAKVTLLYGTGNGATLRSKAKLRSTPKKFFREFRKTLTVDPV